MKNWKYAEEAYRAFCGQLSEPSDEFWSLDPNERDGWYAAAQAVIESVCRGE